MSENDSEMALDPRVEQEIDEALNEENLIGGYHGDSSDNDRVPLVEDFAPNENEWGGKSIFYKGQPRSITLADNLSKAFPVLLPSEEFIDEFIDDYEMRLTSVDGVARDQLMRIFRSMFGSGTTDDEAAPNALQIALSAGPENDE